MLHPIENIIQTTMQQIREMVDVNTIVGAPVPGAEGTTIIPISKVSLGFSTGGGEYRCGAPNMSLQEPQQERFPFAGNTLAGFCVTPMAFLAITADRVSILPVQYNSTLDRVVELVPRVLSEIHDMTKSAKQAQSGDIPEMPRPQADDTAE